MISALPSISCSRVSGSAQTLRWDRVWLATRWPWAAILRIRSRRAKSCGPAAHHVLAVDEEDRLQPPALQLLQHHGRAEQVGAVVEGQHQLARGRAPAGATGNSPAQRLAGTADTATAAAAPPDRRRGPRSAPARARRPRRATRRPARGGRRRTAVGRGRPPRGRRTSAVASSANRPVRITCPIHRQFTDRAKIQKILQFGTLTGSRAPRDAAPAGDPPAPRRDQKDGGSREAPSVLSPAGDSRRAG